MSIVSTEGLYYFANLPKIKKFSTKQAKYNFIKVLKINAYILIIITLQQLKSGCCPAAISQYPIIHNANA